MKDMHIVQAFATHVLHRSLPVAHSFVDFYSCDPQAILDVSALYTAQQIPSFWDTQIARHATESVTAPGTEHQATFFTTTVQQNIQKFFV